MTLAEYERLCVLAKLAGGGTCIWCDPPGILRSDCTACDLPFWHCDTKVHLTDAEAKQIARLLQKAK